METKNAFDGKLNVGNPHVRFDLKRIASTTAMRATLTSKKITMFCVVMLSALVVFAKTWRIDYAGIASGASRSGRMLNASASNDAAPEAALP